MERVFEINLPKDPGHRPLAIRALRKIKHLLIPPPPAAEIRGWPQMPYPTAEIVYWRPHNGVNFGDELGRTVVELMLAQRGHTVFDSVSQPRGVLSIGSILHFANDRDVIWGSGVNGSVPAKDHKYKNLDVRAVRGPVTRQFLKAKGIEVPEIYGDPALLIKRLTGNRFQKTGKYAVGIVPNMFDMALIKREGLLKPFKDVHLVDPTGSWNSVVEKILECDHVISSSLHGLIIADTYGIPSRYVRLTDHEGLLKYEDYYEGTGRRLTLSRTIREALDQGPVTPPDFDLSPLEAAFPYDVWSSQPG